MRTPDPETEPLLRVEGVPPEEHHDEVCIHCGHYRTLVPRDEVVVALTYRGDEDA
jgi:hypothetical protein